MVDAATATTMMNNAGQGGTQSNPYGPPASPYDPAAVGIGNMVHALLQQIKKNQNPGGLGSFEGNVASPANPFNSGPGGGTYGMPGQDPSQGGAPQAPQDPAFSGGASAVPYTDPTMQALFSQPPTG
jgi:hypothetical protein